MLFPSKCPSKGPDFLLEGNFLPSGNAGNSLSELQEIKHFLGGMPPEPSEAHT